MKLLLFVILLIIGTVICLYLELTRYGRGGGGYGGGGEGRGARELVA
jgi:hypothetical protein